jgi:cis-3-alkyl-4-acyloxetan-2-one decarboxylase
MRSHPESHRVDGIELHIDGQGPTVVMIHGWPDTHRLWDGQVNALRKHYRCVRFTLPGFDVAGPANPKSVRELLALIQRIVDAASPSDPVTLLLHDWGAVLGYQYAAKHSSRVARVIGVDIGDTFSRAFFKMPLRAKLMIGGYQGFLAATRFAGPLATPATRWMAKLLGAPNKAEEIGAQQNYLYRQFFVSGFRDAVNYKPTCPTLYMYGSRKPFTLHSNAWLDTVRATRSGEVHVFDCGHWVMLDQPEAFNEAVLQWLKKTDST